MLAYGGSGGAGNGEWQGTQAQAWRGCGDGEGCDGAGVSDTCC